MKKKFDAVRFQRDVRRKLSERYTADPEGFCRKLKREYEHLLKAKAGVP